jgi:hypothetical protein
MTGNLGWRCAFAEGNESEMTSSPTNVSVTHWNNCRPTASSSSMNMMEGAAAFA